MKEDFVLAVHAVTQWVQTHGAAWAVRGLSAFLIFLAGLVAIWMLSKILKKTLLKTRLGESSLMARFVVSVVVKSAWAVLFVVVLGQLGVDVAPLIAGLGVTGFILGFAFQESLGSLAAGLMIALNQPFKVGDYVRVADYEGTIVALDMMAVTLATPDNRRITIPNKQAWGSPIVNYSSQESRRVEFTLTVSARADVPRALATARETIASLAGVLPDPAPLAEVKSLDGQTVTLTARVWSKTADFWTVFFAGNRLLKEAFDRAEIALPAQQIDVLMNERNNT